MSLYSKERGYDLFDDDEDTDSEGNNTSSEDEIDIILHGTPEQRRKLQHLYRKQDSITKGAKNSGKKPFKNGDSSSEDDFEKEMNAELDSNVRNLEDARTRDLSDNRAVTGASCSGVKMITAPDRENGKAVADKFYDEIYFDSDEEMDEEAGTTSKPKRKDTSKHEVISNDDLLYDPSMDDEDQKWVDGQRQQHRPRRANKKGQREKMPNSDALLDCPACMTTLCIDCQRHDTYKHQYRAMFVMNCTVDNTESLHCPEQAPKKRKKNKKKGSGTGSAEVDSNSSDMFHPVKCTECSTVVGVIDADDVYHFFNVLASHT